MGNIQWFEVQYRQINNSTSTNFKMLFLFPGNNCFFTIANGIFKNDAIVKKNCETTDGNFSKK